MLRGNWSLVSCAMRRSIVQLHSAFRSLNGKIPSQPQEKGFTTVNVFEFTFPDCDHVPSGNFYGFASLLVTFPVPKNLGFPPIATSRGPFEQATILMPVPKTPMDE